MRAASALSGWLWSTTASAASTRSETCHAVTAPNSTTSVATTAPISRRRPGSVTAAARIRCTLSAQAVRRPPPEGVSCDVTLASGCAPGVPLSGTAGTGGGGGAGGAVGGCVTAGDLPLGRWQAPCRCARSCSLSRSPRIRLPGPSVPRTPLTTCLGQQYGRSIPVATSPRPGSCSDRDQHEMPGPARPASILPRGPARPASGRRPTAVRLTGRPDGCRALQPGG